MLWELKFRSVLLNCFCSTLCHAFCFVASSGPQNDCDCQWSNVYCQSWIRITPLYLRGLRNQFLQHFLSLVCKYMMIPPVFFYNARTVCIIRWMNDLFISWTNCVWSITGQWGQYVEGECSVLLSVPYGDYKRDETALQTTILLGLFHWCLCRCREVTEAVLLIWNESVWDPWLPFQTV